MTLKRCSCFFLFFFSSRSNVNTLLLKMVSHTKQAEYTPYFRPKWQNLYPISDQKCLKTVPFGAAHNHKALTCILLPDINQDWQVTQLAGSETAVGASGNVGGGGEGGGRGEKEKGRKEPLGTNRVKAVQPPPLRYDADGALNLSSFSWLGSQSLFSFLGTLRVARLRSATRRSFLCSLAFDIFV